MRWNTQTRQAEPQVLAVVIIHGHEVHIDGDERYFDTGVPVVDPETGHRLTFEEDPELWAKNLSYAYRSGDIEVSAQEVSAPVHSYAQATRRRP